MRNKITVGILIALVSMPVISASYRFNYTLTANSTTPTPPASGDGEWIAAPSQYGDWVNKGQIYNCSNWSPAESSQGKGMTFIQTATNCSQDQESWEQKYKKNTKNSEIVADGGKLSISHTITVSDSRESIGILENWISFDPSYTSWVDTNALYGCTAWTPNPAVFTDSHNFTQTSSACKTDQERQRQDREQERFTAEVRNIGSPVTENQTLNGQAASRAYSVVLSAWAAVGEPYDCTNWSPSPETVGKGVAFNQNATDCKLDQARTRAESYQDHVSHSSVNVPSSQEQRSLTGQASSKPAVGTLEAWMATTPTYTAWVNTSALNSCSNWSPAGSTKTTSSTFTQTATNCTTDQSRTRQDREAEQNTGEIRDKGVAVEETQTLSAQSASRSYTVTLGSWTNSGAKYACSNWSPAPATVAIGTSFTQTATDCKQDQTRPRSESYVDHKSGQGVAVSSTSETQTLTAQTNTQSATGTKETWVAATSTYTAWVDTSALNACSNWSPAASTKTATGSFTQTANNCTTDQTRNRQDREQESTTLVYRNKGAPVAETQTITSQTATRSYSVVVGSWLNNGAKYECSNWSPSVDTITAGQSFTQTATDCKQNQTRTRSESYIDHKSGQTVVVSTPSESQTLTAQSDTRNATGTKAGYTCVYNYLGARTGTYIYKNNSNETYDIFFNSDDDYDSRVPLTVTWPFNSSGEMIKPGADMGNGRYQLCYDTAIHASLGG